MLATVLLAAGCRGPEAHLLFQRGELAEAAAAYRAALAAAPGSPLVHYDLGATLLRMERYEDARPHLELATRSAEQRVRQWAHYNLGNSYLEPVFAGESETAREELLRKAIAAYKRALLLDADDQDAKWNLELARRLLEREPQIPRAGGGGGGGGGGGAQPQQGRRDPSPLAGGGAGPSPQLTREQAEQLLGTAEQRELGVQREKLRRPQPPVIAH